MKRLISRYLSQMEEKKEEEIITLEDLENTKQDLLKEVSNLWQRKSLPLIFRQNVESKRLKDLETSMQELLREIKNLSLPQEGRTPDKPSEDGNSGADGKRLFP